MALAVVGCGEAPPPPPPPGLSIDHYEVQLFARPGDRYIEVAAVLYVTATDSAEITLLLDRGLEVASVSVNEAAAQYRRRGGTLRFAVPSGASRISLGYAGAPTTGVFAESGVTFTDGWPQRVAGWLPGFHLPDHPATLDLTLVVPHGIVPIASGTPVDTVRVAAGDQYRYRLARPTPTYAMAWAVGAFSVQWDAPGNIAHFTMGGDPRQLGRTAAMLDSLTAMFGPYPHDTYATVEVPMEFAGMENAGAAFLQSQLYGQRRPDGTPIVEEVNVHEIVHQWFGNVVIPARWNDFWISEGAATYFAAELYGRFDGPEARRRRLLDIGAMDRRDAERQLVPERVRDPWEVLSTTPYLKGAALYHLLHLRLGDEAFYSAIRAAVSELGAAPQPISTDEYRAFIQQRTGSNLEPIFDYWAHGNRRPTLRLSWDESARLLSWEIEGDGGTLSGLPVEIVVQQGGMADRVVRLNAGSARLAGTSRPTVAPVGVPMRITFR